MWILSLALLMEIDDKPTRGQMAALSVAESRAVVELYEGRIISTKLDVQQCQIVAAHRQHVALNRYWLFTKSQAITELAYRESRLDYDFAIIEIEQAKAQVVEAEKNLVLAKVRLQMAELRQREGIELEEKKDVEDITPKPKKSK